MNVQLFLILQCFFYLINFYKTLSNKFLNRNNGFSIFFIAYKS